ncbi:tail fiber assembly protein [Yersinia ruckeri]|uniref:tail fiber assembly protein n=1 Tax=Yersinia ruckeri TaxID=29486 RepID=UPI002238D676|nr:tail fiber assembly protein [Yersinia ruckeri]MCW6567863.1 tail fiber assembly protein [Yersinia ruckeri]
MTKAELDSEFIATVAGEITAYNFDGISREYLSSSVEYLAVGVGLPAHSCIDAPPSLKDGFVVCRTEDFSAWEYVDDHRGDTVYSKDTGQPLIISMLGEYPLNITLDAPVTPYDKWDGEKWVTDSTAKHDADIADAEQHRQTLLAQVDELTSDWRVELMLGDISEENKKKLSSWMAYKTAVKAVDVSTAPDVSWPAQPEA